MAVPNSATLKESLEWIRRNPDATNHDVPTKLRDLWVYEVDDELIPSGFHLAVFTYGFCSKKLTGTNGEKLNVPASEVLEKFYLWQMKLSLAEVNEKTELKSAPLPLYNFPSDEQVECWLVRA